MAIYGYCRVSTQQQVNSGDSLEVQQKKIKGYALIIGKDITKIFIEKGVSGTREFSKRSAGKKLIKILKGGDIIIVPKLDRIFRSAHDALQTAEIFKKRSIELHIIDIGGDVNNSGIGKLFFTMVAAFAEFESDRISERIIEVKANQKERGRYLGGKVQFGYTKNKEGFLIPNKREQEAIKYMVKLREEGKSLYVIARIIKDSRGCKLSHTGVKKIIEREKEKINK